ncbi:hypothetical protein, conserved [Eimeria maxima]|uniref:DUF6832 domain-containing protein n=1 Tax=Eimeria maxima TaxID=5804 RepID=U6M883_EIMMA|nr:hypothetical protein, conserved [Eimeria maxima]CDJ60422.1 hypothetical protein, conserved [Eimeria maxima]
MLFRRSSSSRSSGRSRCSSSSNFYRPNKVSCKSSSNSNSSNNSNSSSNSSSTPRVFSSRPTDNLPNYYHEKLNKANSNPRTIIKLYRKHIREVDEPEYKWLPEMVPRLLYAMAALEYRSYHLLPTLLEHVEANIHRWRLPSACNMAICLALMGVGDNSGKQMQLASPIITSSSDSSSDSSSSSSSTLQPPAEFGRYLDAVGCSPFDKISLAFALAITNQYECGLIEGKEAESPIVLFIKKACEQVSNSSSSNSNSTISTSTSSSISTSSSSSSSSTN